MSIIKFSFFFVFIGTFLIYGSDDQNLDQEPTEKVIKKVSLPIEINVEIFAADGSQKIYESTKYYIKIRFKSVAETPLFVHFFREHDPVKGGKPGFQIALPKIEWIKKGKTVCSHEIGVPASLLLEKGETFLISSGEAPKEGKYDLVIDLDSSKIDMQKGLGTFSIRNTPPKFIVVKKKVKRPILVIGPSPKSKSAED